VTLRPLLAPLLALGLLSGLVATPTGEASAREYDADRLEQDKASVPADEANLAAGLELWARWCAACHGADGKGDGPAAAQLWPRPRDFSYGLFKLRSTGTGELPTDADVFRSIARGVPGTSMPAWGEGPAPLTDAELWQLVHAVKSLVPYIDWTSADFDPYREGVAVAVGAPPTVTPELLAVGEAVYSDEQRGGCLRCHGRLGRGDGKDRDAGLDDDWGDPLPVTDLTNPRRYKNGSGIADVFLTLSAGLNGTPMPSYVASLSEEERWGVAAFVVSMLEPVGLDEGALLVATALDAAPPLDPLDVAWQALPRLEIPVVGQVLVGPRHENHSVDRIWLRAAVGGDRLAVQLTWNDRTASDTAWTPKEPDAAQGWLKARKLWRASDKRPDGLALQLPVRATAHPVKPHFYRGGPAGDVALWRWSAADDAAVELDSTGWASLPRTRADEAQHLQSQAVFEDGRWSVVLSHPRTADGAELALEPGMLLPVAVQVWDGGLGETITACGLTSWVYVRLPAPVPAAGYAAAAAATGGSFVLVLLAVGWARREEEGA
jgi:mono/diheme cytochrome c family protein